jgi:hypothetical protein
MVCVLIEGVAKRAWYVRESALLRLRLNPGANELKFVDRLNPHFITVYLCIRSFLATTVPSSIVT